MENNYLPQENIPKISKKHFRDVFTISFLVVLLANYAAYLYLAESTPNLGSRVIMEKWKMLENLPETDWLILGDSSCNQGIRPEIFQDNFGGKTYNLCTIANLLTVGDAWMLDYYTKKNNAPKNILIVHTYDIWHRENLDLSAASQTPINTILSNKLEPQDILSKVDIIRLYFNKYFPLYFHNFSLRASIENYLKGKKTEKLTFSSEGYMFDWKADIKAVKNDSKKHKRYIRSHSFRMSKNNGTGLKKIKELAEKHNMKVYFAFSPVYEGVYEDSNFSKHVSGSIAYLHKNFCNSENIKCIDDIFIFPQEVMANVDHITSSGATTYTTKIIEKIKLIK